MARVKQPEGAPCLRPMNSLRPVAGWMRVSARLATGDANAERWSGHGQRCHRYTVESRLGSFGNRGNGRYQEELRKGLAAIGPYLATHQLSQERARLAARWAIWEWGGALRCGWLRECSPWQRVQRA